MNIKLDGPNAEAIEKLLLTWSLDDGQGQQADMLTLNIDASDLSSAPPSGTSYQVYIEGESRGVFNVSHVTPTWFPKRLSITLSPAKFTTSDATGFREARTQTYENLTLDELAKTLMVKHGYKVIVDPSIASKKITLETQSQETDSSFLYRIAKDKFDALTKPIDDKYIIGRRGAIKKLSGANLAPVVINHTEDGYSPILSGQAPIPTQGRWKGVKAKWHDTQKGATQELELGESNFTTLPLLYESETEAREAAEAKLRSIKRAGQTLTMTINGQKGLFAEALLMVNNLFSPFTDEPWSIDQVTLNGSRTKYTAAITASRPTE